MEPSALAPKPLPSSARLAQGVACWGLYAIVMTVPLVLTTATDEWFSMPKVVLLRVLTLVVVMAWGMSVIWSGKVRLGRTALDLPLVVYLGVNLLGTVHSVAPALSLYGLHFRQDGLITVVNWILIYYLAVTVLQGQGQFRRGLELQALAGVTVAVIGILQHFGFPLFGLDPYYFGARIYSTVGNPDFLGTYLVLTLPLAGGLMLSCSPRARPLWATVVTLLSLTLLFSFTRGAWIGGGVAAVAFLVLCFGELRRNKAWVLGVTGVLAFIILANQAGWLEGLRMPSSLREGEGAPAAPTVSRTVGSIGELRSGTAEVRLLMWEGSLDLIRENPILGTGLNGFMPAFGRYAPVEYARGEGLERFPDKAHNVFIGTTVELGLVGLASYLWLLGAFGWAFWRWWRHSAAAGSSRSLVGAIMAAWLGYQAQSFFLFPVVYTGALYFWQMGAAVGLMGAMGGATGLTQERAVSWGEPWLGGRPAVMGAFSLGAMAFGGWLIFLAVKPLVADIYFRQSQLALSEVHSYGGPPPEAIDRSLALARTAIAWYSKDMEFHRRTAAVFNIRASMAEDLVLRRALYGEMVSYLSNAIALNPRQALLYYQRGLAYENYQTYHQLDALADYERAVEFFPNYWNGNAALAEVAHRLGRLDVAIAAERQLLKIFPHSTDVSLQLGGHYLDTGRLDEAIQEWGKILRFEPENADAYFWLGEAYRRKGDANQAVINYRTALSFNPHLEAARQALERLGVIVPRVTAQPSAEGGG